MTAFFEFSEVTNERIWCLEKCVDTRYAGGYGVDNCVHCPLSGSGGQCDVTKHSDVTVTYGCGGEN